MEIAREGKGLSDVYSTLETTPSLSYISPARLLYAIFDSVHVHPIEDVLDPGVYVYV